VFIAEVYQDLKGKENENGISSSFSFESEFSVSDDLFSLLSICYGEPQHFNCDARRIIGDGMKWCKIDDLPWRPTSVVKPPTLEVRRAKQTLDLSSFLSRATHFFVPSEPYRSTKLWKSAYVFGLPPSATGSSGWIRQRSYAW